MVSSVGHFVLILFLATDLAAMLFILLGLSSPPAGVREPIVLEVHMAEDPLQKVVPEMLVAVEPYDKQQAFAAAEAVAGELDFADPALQKPLDYDYQPSESTDSPTHDMQQFIQQNLQAAITQANDQSAEQNLDRLDELASRPSAEPVAGTFDSDTGQINDVIRKPKEPEGYIYVAIMVDSQGREMEVELSGPEAKQAFETFEKIKRYPFLDAIYRNVVMSLLDGMMKK